MESVFVFMGYLLARHKEKKSGRRIIRRPLCLSHRLLNIILEEKKSTEGTIKVFDVRCYGLEEAAFQVLQRTPPNNLKFLQIISNRRKTLSVYVCVARG